MAEMRKVVRKWKSPIRKILVIFLFFFFYLLVVLWDPGEQVREAVFNFPTHTGQ